MTTCRSQAFTLLAPRRAIPRICKQSQEQPGRGQNTSRGVRRGETQGWDVTSCLGARVGPNLCTQSGSDISASIASTCLENLETLNEKGVNMDVICNTTGAVYAGWLHLSSYIPL